jgi:hypothetical protein
MAIGIKINAAFNIDNTIYDATMTLPTSAPSATEPFLFVVTSAPAATPADTTTLLTVAVGIPGEVFVAVAPPTDLIATAAGNDIVTNLNVQVAEGNFDITKGQFIASTPTPPGTPPPPPPPHA